MAGWGIGIGSFASGLSTGLKTGLSITDALDKRKIREQELGLRKKADDRAERASARADKAESRAEQAFTTTQKINAQKIRQNDIAINDAERARKHRDAMDSLVQKGSAEYKAAVEAGDAEPNHAYEWFSQNYAPHVEQALLSQGDLKGAAKWHTWAHHNDTKRQVQDMGRLIGQYHSAVQTGDFDQFGKSVAKFYNGLSSDLRDGATFQSLNVDKDASGNISGIHAVIKQKDGKTTTQTWSDLGSFQQTLNAWANPAAIYEHTMKSAAAAQKFKANVAEYAAKKEAEQGAKLRGKIAERSVGISGKTPRERYAAAQAVLAKSSLDGKPPTDADVRTYLRQQDEYAASHAPGVKGAGAAAPPVPQKMIIDTKTGKPVSAAPAASSAPAQPAPPAASPADVTAPPPASSQPEPAPAGTQPQPSPAPAGAQSRPAPVAPGIGVRQPPVDGPAAAPASVMQPQSGAAVAPRYQDNGPVVDGGKALSDAAQGIKDAASYVGRSSNEAFQSAPEVKMIKKAADALMNAVPKVGKSQLSRVNAASMAAGLGDLPALPDGKGSLPAVKAAADNYPIIKKAGAVAAVRSSKMAGDDRKIEFWPPGEKGTKEHPRPKGLPLNRPGVELFGKNVKPSDVAADIVSHYLVHTDPALKAEYGNFVRSFATPEAQARLRKDYEWAQKNEGEKRPFTKWAAETRIPAYFRGYVFQQWPESAYKEMYSPEQLDQLQQMSRYIHEGGRAVAGR